METPKVGSRKLHVLVSGQFLGSLRPWSYFEVGRWADDSHTRVRPMRTAIISLAGRIFFLRSLQHCVQPHPEVTNNVCPSGSVWP